MTTPMVLLDQDYMNYLHNSYEEKRAEVRVALYQQPIELAYHTLGLPQLPPTLALRFFW